MCKVVCMRRNVVESISMREATKSKVCRTMFVCTGLFSVFNVSFFKRCEFVHYTFFFLWSIRFVMTAFDFRVSVYVRIFTTFRVVSWKILCVRFWVQFEAFCAERSFCFDSNQLCIFSSFFLFTETVWRHCYSQLKYWTRT